MFSDCKLVVYWPCRYLKLPNELKALLISDSTTEKASAALAVRIGKLSTLPSTIECINNTFSVMLFGEGGEGGSVCIAVLMLLYMPACVCFSTLLFPVCAGGLSDPEELAGLAHFCEHMLFLGTEKVHRLEVAMYVCTHVRMQCLAAVPIQLPQAALC